MKKSIILMLLFFVALSGFAQEKTRHFELSANSSILTLTNYPALSLFEDNTPSYSNYSQGVNLGYVLGKNVVGVQLQSIVFNTFATALDESVRCFSTGLYVRRYDPLSSKIELSLGLNLGLNLVQNTFRSDDAYSSSEWRNGLNCQTEIGLNYRLGNGAFFGLSAGFDLGGSLNHANISIPAGWNGNPKSNFGGYRLSLTYGLRF